ncbi:Glutamate--cysteine ligase [hydrothermal vent metagenome]|uniref:glutamate--cysteine ligase n=1 Tax=hydrothermal vent metagenome TaxID=652676 RepID=A0A3B0TJ27_9ZZZZ
MAVVETDLPPIECRDQLAAYLESGSKPKSAWRIGTEHEKFGFHRADFSPVAYGGTNGIRALLEGLRDRFGWSPIVEDGKIIGLQAPASVGGGISLEPGGQLELSGAPLENLHQTCDEVHTHLHQVREVASGLDLGFLGLGFSPKWQLEDVPSMPKSRYAIMSRYMPKVGGSGLDMMYRTCTVQVNLDFSDEADMVKKLRTSLALQPIATALFANSPFVEGKPSGMLSTRAHVWLDTDEARAGQLPFVFEDGMGFERYVDYALDVPMYFVARKGKYIDVAGASFRDFLDGKLDALPGVKPNMADWESHLTTLFPDVRLKRYIEMRGADGGPWRRLCALPALWVGVFYDGASLDAAWDLVKDWTGEAREKLRRDVPAQALEAEIGGRKVADIAADFIEISRAGLNARARTDCFGDNEEHFLNAVEVVVEEGRTPAEEMLEKYHGSWGGDIDQVFTEYAY